jgi:CYTH domain-containing protein
MPIENERKYVLHPSIEEELSSLTSVCYKIDQGYIQNSAEGLQVRFRKVRSYKHDKKYDTKRIFTLKSKNADFTSTEIETEVSKDDFKAVWPKVTNQLSKTRHKVFELEGYWEIDVFHGPNGNYFWMAEIELPDKKEWPDSVPEYITKHLLFKVPLTDNRFSSRKLYDETYANNILNTLLEGKSNESE